MATTPGEARPDPILSAPVALGLLVGLLVVLNLTRSTLVPDAWHLGFNIATGVAAMALGRVAGLTAVDVGAARAHVAPGFRLGGLAFSAITVVVVCAGLAGLLTDGRVDGSFGDMILRTLVVIPVGTVLVEELAFRGVLHGLLVRVTSARWAFMAGALLFGLWHVFPAWRDGAVETDLAEVGQGATVLATSVATTAAGVMFVWLRVRSQSLIAPILAHLATNSVTFAVVWAMR